MVNGEGIEMEKMEIIKIYGEENEKLIDVGGGD